jgi:hypothetical protein
MILFDFNNNMLKEQDRTIEWLKFLIIVVKYNKKRKVKSQGNDVLRKSIEAKKKINGVF